MSIIRSKKFIIPLFIIIIGIPIQFFITYKVEEKSLLNEIDRDLLSATSNIKYYLGENYVNSNLNSRTYNKEEAIAIFTKLQEKAEEQYVDYLYVLIKSGDDIVYAALSDYEEELLDTVKGYFWYSLKEAEDDSFDETWDAFDREEPLFIESTDEWDSYRSVYLTETAPDGTKYIAGADLTITNLENRIMARTVKTMRIFLIVFPLFVSFLIIGKEKEDIEGEINKLLKKDSLTGCFNRKYGLKTLKKIVNEQAGIKIFMVDIRGLNKINAGYGLSAGDKLIKIFSAILKKSVRREDITVRMEGDKFLVILPEFPDSSEQLFITNLNNNIEFFNLNNKRNIYIEITYLFRRYRGEEVEEFIENILIDLITKKKYIHKNEIELVQEMFQSIEEQNFVVYYQPKVHLVEKYISYEALIRWEHPKRGLVFPGEFIEIAEKSEVINKLTLFVLSEALKAAKELNTKISINISAVSFSNERFINKVKAVLEKSKYSGFLIFEITEGIAIYDLQLTLEKIDEFKEYGVEFSIDDFGTGYSSLGYIERLPVKEVKIDKTFVDDLKLKVINQMIIKFICKVSTILGFEVIIEGVEEEEQIREVIKLGGVSFQGYFFDRPQPIDVTIKNKENCLDKMDIFKDIIKKE